MAVITEAAPPSSSLSMQKGGSAPQDKLAAAQGAPVIEAAAPESVPEEALSPRFAALARGQKLLHQSQQQFKAEREAWKVKQAEYEQNYIPREKIKSDPLSVLISEGYSHEQIAQLILDQAGRPQDPAYRRMEEEIAELKKKQDEPLKRIEEIQNKQREQAVINIRNEVKLLVDSDPDLETVKEMRATEQVVELITRVFDETGELMTPESASKQIEAALLERALKFAGLKKVQSKLSPQIEGVEKLQVEQKKPSQIPLPNNSPQLKTLTNAATAAPSRPKTQAERIARAKAAFYGQQTP